MCIRDRHKTACCKAQQNFQNKRDGKINNWHSELSNLEKNGETTADMWKKMWAMDMTTDMDSSSSSSASGSHGQDSMSVIEE